MSRDKTLPRFIGIPTFPSEFDDLDRLDLNNLEMRKQVGGKAYGLLCMRSILSDFHSEDYSGITIDIPAMTVLCTSVFDAFLEQNDLYRVVNQNRSDDEIGYAFQQADMPFEILGELRNLVERVTIPLAVRSSGMLEDVARRPFAGVYLTKMIPNNALDADTRFRKLVEAIKAVWASTFYKTARDYCKATGLCNEDERMAVIIQEMVGKRYHERFYPELSGVGRSYNFYPIKPAKPEEGVISLAFGLGKTIVDGEKSWTYSPAYPQRPPPFGSIEDLLEQTQRTFWSVNMGEQLEYDPIRETEYMRLENITVAERDDSLRYVVSTYHPETGSLTASTSSAGPRAITFAPLLVLKQLPVNKLINDLLRKCEAAFNSPVEIEFAMTFDPNRFGFLQVRQMVLPSGDQQVSLANLDGENILLASQSVLGNGVIDTIQDIVYVRPEHFDFSHTKQIANELEIINNQLLSEDRPYLLIVFGRLGTFDPWLGVPVSWGQICGAKVIVEASQENVKVEMSQGTHYFHNIINLGVKYFSIPFFSPYKIDWEWLHRQQVMFETDFIRHIRLSSPIKVVVDGRHGVGAVYKQ